ncbi:MAG: glycosyltransferase family 2 protein [Burkholderiales bacterium]
MTQPGTQLRYALVTPARNEQDFIGQTIRAVVAQTVRPVKWIIVSDGSTDRTDEIVATFAQQHDWIELARMPVHRDRTFAAKATCFNEGYGRLKALSFEIVGNLDADITMEPDYFEFLMGKFREMPDLGVAGTPYVEDTHGTGDHSASHREGDIEHVSGACQMFRRECFEDIGGGYMPIKGGVDWVAVTTARMKGWRTRTFVEMSCRHHRRMGTADRGPLMARFRHGQEDYTLGGHPLWQVVRSTFQMTKSPMILGGLFLGLGYFWAMAKRMPRRIPPDLIAFHRSEQMARMRKKLHF